MRIVGDGTRDKRTQRTAQGVVCRVEGMAPAVPDADWLAGHIVEHPARARLHARLVDAVAEHIIVIPHDHSIPRVDNGALVTFDVEIDPGRVLFLYHFDSVVWILTLELVMSNGKEGTPERVGVGDGRGGGMFGRLLGVLPFRICCEVAYAPLMPVRQVVRIR